MADRNIPLMGKEDFERSYRMAISALTEEIRFISDETAHLMYGIYERLAETSKHFNLTAITEGAAVAEKHLADSVYPFHLLETLSLFPDGAKLCDIGAGAGFPTLPVAAASDTGALPRVEVCAVDSTAKKIRYIAGVAEELGLTNVTAVAGRAEALAAGAMRESFDIVSARAVASMPILLELAAPFVKVGGILAALKAHATEEVADAERGAELLGLSKAELHEYTLPSGDKRTLVIYRKMRPTPKKYPREYRLISASPLR